MVAIYRLLLAAASLVTASAIPTSPLVALEKRQSSAGGACSSPEFEPVTMVGGSGTPFCESSWGTTYLPVTGVTIWSNDDDVTGLQLTYADDTQSPVLGRTASVKQTSITVAYGSNNLWKTVKMWNRPANQYVLHTLLSNTKGDTINNGEAVTQDPDASQNVQNVGSGVLFGVVGSTCGSGNLASLGFLFLASPIVNIGVTNVTFPNGPLGGADGINPTTIGTAHFENTNSNPVTYQFNNQISEMQTWTFAQAITNTFTVQEAIAF